MVLLHFKPLEDIRWSELLGVDQVEIIVTRSVVRDLDKHKNTHVSKKVRERARRVLKQLEDIPSGGRLQLRDGVTLSLNLQLPTIDLREHHLEPAWTDDVLLATILSFPAPDGCNILFISDDTGARIKGRQLHIPVFAPPDDLRLPTDEDPAVIENRKLRAEVARLSAPAVPELRVEFDGGRDYVRCAVAVPDPETSSRHKIDERLNRVKEQVLRLDSSGKTGSMAFGALAMVSPEEVARYNDALPAFYDEYANYLKACVRIQRELALTCKCELFLANTGRAPAQDIDITIHFPDGFAVRSVDDLPRVGDPPQPPPRPRTVAEMMGATLPDLGSLFQPRTIDFPTIGPSPNVSPPTIKPSNSTEVSYSVGTLKHSFTVSLGSLGFTFNDLDKVRSFEAEYWINAANLPDDVQGKIRVVVERQAV
jgi:hypothetical protein